MKILFGIPKKNHFEIAEAEILALNKSGAEILRSQYGNPGTRPHLLVTFGVVLKNAFTLKRKLIKQRSDFVYLNTAFDTKTLIRDSITLFILKFFNKKVKVILKLHGSLKSVVMSNNFFKKYLFKQTDLFLVLSQEELNNFREAGLEKAKGFITANVVDPSIYVPDKEFKRKKHIPEDNLVLLYVGRFIKEKGILDLIHACRLLKENLVDFQLICLGNGPLFEQAQSLTESLDLKNEIKFEGHVDESQTNCFYSNCDILILPTYHEEGFPMAVFKAAACAKPIITTKIRAAADYLTSFENCLWVEPRDPKDIYEKIQILAHDPDLRKKLGKNNYNLVRRFSAEKITNNLYLKLISLIKA